jgi:hypothetical protein
MGAALSIPRTSEFWARAGPTRACTRRAANYRVGGTFLWKAAWCFFVPGCHGRKPGSARVPCSLRGKASDVAAGMRRSATLRDLCQEERKGVDTCADYVVKYREMLRYDRYLAEGSPLPRGSLRGPAVTSSKTAWTSPGPAGDCAAPRRY